MLSRRSFLKTMALGGATFSVMNFANAVENKKQTNFVIFLTDDQGYGDLGCYGNPILKTPNIDKFTSEGMKFTDGYAPCPVCSPTRAAILTGRTPYRNGVYTWIPPGSLTPYLRTSEITIPKMLKERDYATCHVGKWHLNGLFNSSLQPQPNDHGYDHWIATQNNAHPNHINPDNFVRNGEPVGELKGESSILIVEEALWWLKENKNTGNPFFLTVWTHEPHRPIESAQRFMDLYKGHTDEEDQRQYFGNISQIDSAFGMLMKGLDELGYTDNTFVAYMSDNGPEGSGRPDQKGRSRGKTGGLRGRKRSIYEGGIRVPFIIRWPGHIKPDSISNEPVIGMDFFPTICAITGSSLPQDRTIDGTSLMPLFNGKKIERKIPLYWRYHGMAMRDGDWKIILKSNMEKCELYNLRDDIAEENNLAEKEPERLARMKKKLIEINEGVEKEGPGWWKIENGAGRPVLSGSNGTIDLKPADAKTFGSMGYQSYSDILQGISVFKGITRNGYAEWEIKNASPGRYNVEITFAYGRSDKGTMVLDSGCDILTLGTDNLGEERRGINTITAGEINLGAGESTISLKPENYDAEAKKGKVIIDALKRITLSPINL